MFTLFETLMNAAQLRRLFLLKEINTRRRIGPTSGHLRNVVGLLRRGTTPLTETLALTQMSLMLAQHEIMY